MCICAKQNLKICTQIFCTQICFGKYLKLFTKHQFLHKFIYIIESYGASLIRGPRAPPPTPSPLPPLPTPQILKIIINNKDVFSIYSIYQMSFETFRTLHILQTELTDIDDWQRCHFLHDRKRTQIIYLFTDE